LSWAHLLEEWLDQNGLELLNPPNALTWIRSQPTNTPSLINLVLANKAAHFLNQLSSISVSINDSIGSDHMALMLTFYPIDSLAVIPPPIPKGYNMDPKCRDNWMKEFYWLMLEELSCESIGLTPLDLESMIHNHLKFLDDAIEEACCRTLKPCHAPQPEGANWWNDTCSQAHTQAHMVPAGPECDKASRNLRHAIITAKYDWAYQHLHKAIDM
jgi:hypothetical protein